jgi:hypothetical protein
MTILAAFAGAGVMAAPRNIVVALVMVVTASSLAGIAAAQPSVRRVTISMHAPVSVGRNAIEEQRSLKKPTAKQPKPRDF